MEYVVRDNESLLFWLQNLDGDHADLDGTAAVASAAALNRVLAGNVDERGFVTNERTPLPRGGHHARHPGRRITAFLTSAPSAQARPWPSG